MSETIDAYAGDGYNKDAFYTAPLSKHECAAIKAVGNGTANEQQQKTALKCIIDKFARSHFGAYISERPHDSAFVAGRAFVGQQILHQLNINIASLEIEDDE